MERTRSFALAATLLLATVLLAGCMGGDDGGGDGEPTVTVSLVDPPSYATAGEPVTLTWEISSSTMTTTDHTAIHWGTTSHAGDDAHFGDYEGGLTSPQSGDVPGTYSADVTFEDAGTVYYRAHTMVGDDDNILSMEHSIIVE